MSDAYFGRQVVFFCAGVIGLYAGQALASPPALSDQTVVMGLGAPHAQVFNGPDMEFMAAGGAVGDFDNDGDQDIFVLGGSAAVDHLYINDGFGNFTDMASQAGIDRTHKGTGAAVGDYDNDGDLDIFVTSLGSTIAPSIDGTNFLWSNNGDGTFTDVTSTAGVAATNPDMPDSFSAAFGDYDLDGDLDLAVAGWLGSSKLYRNNGDGTFTDVIVSAIDIPMDLNRAFSPRFVDMDGDLYPELLWVADFFDSKYLKNNTDGTFTDMTPIAGTGLDGNGMGNTFGDYNNDGVFDWYVTSRILPDGSNGTGNMLYMGTAVDHVFAEESVLRGANNGYWGWGAVSVDMNHDGALDIVETNGFAMGFETDPTILYLNDGSGNFSDASIASGLTDAGQGRGLINADLDGDGDQDIIVLNNGQPMVCYRNDIAGKDTNAITLDFDTSAVSGLAPNGFGTRVWFDSASHHQIRYLDGGTSYVSQSQLAVHAGIGSDSSVDVTIQWANGAVDVYPAVMPGTYTIKALACPADLSGDNLLNFFDVSAFLQFFGQGHPQADMNHDGLHNFFDVSAFLVAYGQGCP